ncbi:unnamed protein product, partial [Vitis vinifera]
MCLSFQNIYALVQCTPDLSKLSYSNCIEGAVWAINGISGCCDRKQGGRVVKPSCNIKFKKVICCILYYSARLDKIKNSTINGGISNYVGSVGKNSKTSQIVVLIVVPSAVISIMLIIFICCFFKRRRPRESVGMKTLSSLHIILCFFFNLLLKFLIISQKYLKYILKTIPSLVQDDDEIINIESLQFDFATSRVATNNFSDANKLGQGRFGPIYKVINLVNQSNVINFLIC